MNALLTRALTRTLTLALGLATAAIVHAAPVTLEFTASGFQNAGVPTPGFDGEIKGSISWDSLNLHDPISQLTGIDLTIAGHVYSLAEVGIANQGNTQTAIGGTVRGSNAVVGDGQFDDFLFVFDRVNPRVEAFAYSIKGKTGAIWWTPSHTEARFVTSAQVPEPTSLLLTLAAIAALVTLTAGPLRRRDHVSGPRLSPSQA